MFAYFSIVYENSWKKSRIFLKIRNMKKSRENVKICLHSIWRIFYKYFQKLFGTKFNLTNFGVKIKKSLGTFLLIFQHCVVLILLTSKDVAEEGDASDRPVKRSKGSGMTKKFCFHYFSYLYWKRQKLKTLNFESMTVKKKHFWQVCSQIWVIFDVTLWHTFYKWFIKEWI